MEGVGRGDRCADHLVPHQSIHITTGELIYAFQPLSTRVCSVIFSHTDPDVLFGVSKHQTVRLVLADGSITEFSGHEGSHRCLGDAIATSDDGTVLYVGYFCAHRVVAYDVATLQLKWTVDFEEDVHSIAYSDGLVLVASSNAPLTVLKAEDGSFVRTLGVVKGTVCGISVLAGLYCIACRVSHSHTPVCDSPHLS